MTDSGLHGQLVVETELPALLLVHSLLKLHTSDLAQPTASGSRASIAKEEPGQWTQMQPSLEGLLSCKCAPFHTCCSGGLLWSGLLSWFAFCLHCCSPLSLHTSTIWNCNSTEDLCNFAHPLCYVLPCGPTPTQIYQVQSIFFYLFLIA